MVRPVGVSRERSQDLEITGRQIVEDAERRGRILGVRLPLQDDEEAEPWTAPPSRRREAPIVGDLPASLELVLS